MNDLLPDWVYRNLLRFDNCSIDKNDYKKLGEEKILADLKNHGLNCRIKIHTIQRVHDNPYVLDKYKHKKDTFVIVEVV